jgi:hypothetical protein
MQQKNLEHKMNKTIIALYGRANEGKSSTIKRVVSIFESHYRNATINYLQQGDDVLLTIQIGLVKIGIESQGDPGSRMLFNHTVEKLVTIEKCDIIVCATRTDGNTVKEVDRVADLNNYHTIWKSSYYTSLRVDVANQIAAEEIVRLIEAIIVGRL